jgi:hypothetical protein
MHLARHSGLQPEQATVWMEQESKRERLRELVRLLESELKGEKVMVFLNSVDDVDASCEALQRAGVSCSPYRAKIPLDATSWGAVGRATLQHAECPENVAISRPILRLSHDCKV